MDKVKFPARLGKVDFSYFFFNGEVVYCDDQYKSFYVYDIGVLYHYINGDLGFTLRSAKKMSEAEAQEFGTSMYREEVERKNKKAKLDKIIRKK